MECNPIQARFEQNHFSSKKRNFACRLGRNGCYKGSTGIKCNCACEYDRLIGFKCVVGGGYIDILGNRDL